MRSKSKKLEMIVPSDLTSVLLADEPVARAAPAPAPAPALTPTPTPAPAPAPSEEPANTAAEPVKNSSQRKKRSRRQSDVPSLRRGHQLQASGRVVRRMTVNMELSLGDELAEFCAATRRTQSDVISEGLRLLFDGG